LVTVVTTREIPMPDEVLSIKDVAALPKRAEMTAYKMTQTRENGGGRDGR
jgi:hypothetical protein